MTKDIQIPIKTKDGDNAFLSGVFTKDGSFVVVDDKRIIAYIMGVMLFLLIVLFLMMEQISSNDAALGRLIWESCVNQSYKLPSLP